MKHENRKLQHTIYKSLVSWIDTEILLDRDLTAWSLHPVDFLEDHSFCIRNWNHIVFFSLFFKYLGGNSFCLMTDTYVHRFYKRQGIQINAMCNAWQHLTVCHQFPASSFLICPAPAAPGLSSGWSWISFKYISMLLLRLAASQAQLI